MSPNAPRRINRKAILAKQFILWHWVSSAVCLGAMLFFAVTGITLNHASSFKGKAQVDERTVTLPENLRTVIAPEEGAESVDEKKPLPAEIASWLRKNLGVRLKSHLPEWSQDEIYVSLPKPGGDAWLTIDRESGEVVHEVTYQGAIAFINDLHKGRHTGDAWFWFIDIFSVACVVFCVTGLGLLWVHAKRRPSTWPVVIAGLLIPILIVVFFVH